MTDSKRKVAIFDIDGTIFRSSLVIEFTERLIEEGLFPEEAKRGYEQTHKLWLDRAGSYENYINDVVSVFMNHIQGVDYGKFADIGESVVEEQGQRTYVYTKDLVASLKKQEYFLLAISQSPKTILEPFCKRFGFDKVYGRIYELGPQNKLTGKVVDEHLIANKANIVRRAVDKENLTLEDSLGVGDTEGDLSFLELVETPICFNPNARLYQYAKINNWDVVIERKDVIYKIQ